MTILTKEQAQELLAALPKPRTCDACSKPHGDDIRCLPYGPFTVHVCPACEWKLKKALYRQRKHSGNSVER